MRKDSKIFKNKETKQQNIFCLRCPAFYLFFAPFPPISDLLLLIVLQNMIIPQAPLAHSSALLYPANTFFFIICFLDRAERSKQDVALPKLIQRTIPSGTRPRIEQASHTCMNISRSGPALCGSRVTMERRNWSIHGPLRPDIVALFTFNIQPIVTLL